MVKEDIIKKLCNIYHLDVPLSHCVLTPPRNLVLRVNGKNTLVTLSFTEDSGIKSEGIHYYYNRKVFSLKQYTHKVMYESEEQTLGDVIIPYLEKFCNASIDKEDLVDSDKLIKTFLTNPYTPVIELPCVINNYSVFIECKIKLYPIKLHFKYLFNDLVTRDGDRLIPLYERVNEETSLPLWKLLRQQITERASNE